LPSNFFYNRFKIVTAQKLTRPLNNAAGYLFDHHAVYLEAGKGFLKVYLDFGKEGLFIQTGADAAAWRDSYKEKGSVITSR